MLTASRRDQKGTPNP